MALDPLTGLLALGDSILDKIWPDANEKSKQIARLKELQAQGKSEELQAEVKLLMAQISVNLEATKHKSIFVAGSRPFIIWVCGIGLGFQYILHPLLVWVWYFIGMDGSPPEALDMAVMMPLLLGLLGLGTMRTVEKHKGIHTDKLGDQ